MRGKIVKIGAFESKKRVPGQKIRKIGVFSIEKWDFQLKNARKFGVFESEISDFQSKIEFFFSKLKRGFLTQKIIKNRISDLKISNYLSENSIFRLKMTFSARKFRFLSENSIFH